jgi:hypothetical protein
LICATFDTCKINVASGGQYSAGIEIGKSFWGVQGWEVTTYSGGWGCYVVYPATSTSTIHHIIFANDIANGCGQGGFGASPNGSAGVDYLAVLGSIAFNSVQGWTNCTSGFNVFKPVASDTLPGTHYLFAGDFAWNNVEPETCNGGIPTDGQGFFLDTTQPYSQQMVVENNLSVFNGGSGLKSYNNSTGSPNAPIYFRNNTTYGNETGGVNGAICSEIALQSSLSTEATGNLAVTSAATGCYGESALFALGVSAGNTTDEFSNNYGYSAAGNNTSGSGTGFEFASSNLFGADPMLTNPVQPSAPSCGGTNNVPECMAQVIANFTPTNPAASDYGRQIPSTANISDPLFPAWLCNTKLPQGLVSMGCAVN